MLDITPIPILADNYTWVVRAPNSNTAIVVDPGEAAPVAQALQGFGLKLAGILVTHHHHDHIDGVAELAAGGIPVFGPNDERIPALTHALKAGDRFDPPGLDATFEVFETPGHTLDHIVYYGDEVLFAGDALFAGGCGRMFEGNAPQMVGYLAELRDLPPNTQLYCGHEYTAANLDFAQAVEPDNLHLQKRISEVSAQRKNGAITLPSILSEERETNPFLRWDEPPVIDQASQHAGRALQTPAEVFAVLRDWKDHF